MHVCLRYLSFPPPPPPFYHPPIRYKEGGEALLVLLPSEEKGMVEQLAQRKVPVSEIK